MSFHAKQTVTNLKNLVTRNAHIALSRWLKIRLHADGYEVSMSDAKVAVAGLLSRKHIFRNAKLDFDGSRTTNLGTQIAARTVVHGDPLSFVTINSLSSITDGFELLVLTAIAVRDLMPGGK